MYIENKNTLAFNKLANANKFYAFFICRLFVVYLLPLIIKVLYWYFLFTLQYNGTHIYTNTDTHALIQRRNTENNSEQPTTLDFVL